MYLTSCLVENVGPIDSLYLPLPFNDDGSPKPIILVGGNGSGKSIMLSFIVDALTLFAQTAYYDILRGRNERGFPLFRILGTLNQKIGSEFAISLLRFDYKENIFFYVEKTGSKNNIEYLKDIPKEFNKLSDWKPWNENEDYKNLVVYVIQ